MLENKSDKLSVHFKNEGNKNYTKKLYYDALLSFNKALCYAETKENLALAYANRSLVYFELKNYEICMKNIQLSLDHHPGDKVQTTLNERKVKCSKMMATEETPLNLWDLIKLSYQPNQSIPFISDCLELQNTKFGRGIFTRKSLQAGDIIAIERASSLSFLCAEGKYKKCCKCFKGFMLNLIPCTRTASFMFCSIKCRDLTYKSVENLEWMVSENTQNIHYERILSEIEEAFCGHDKFLKFLSKDLGDIKKFNKTVFDYDFVNNQHAKLSAIKSSLSLLPSTKGISHQVLEAARKVSKGNSSVESFIQHLATILEKNCYLARNDEDIIGDDVQAFDVQRFYPFYSLFNHSCFANVFTLEADDALIFYVVNPIKANEQLFINYLGYRSLNSPTSMRQEKLSTNFGFLCDCILCSNDTSPDEDGLIYEKAKEKANFSQYIMKNEKDLFNAVRENWRVINYNRPLTAESHLLTMHSHLMLEQLVILLTEPSHLARNE